MSSGKSGKMIEHDLASEKAHANVCVWLTSSSQLSCHQLASALRRGGFFYWKDTMDIEINRDDVDEVVVSEVISVLAEAMLDADVEPTPDEMLVALGELMQAVLDEVMGVSDQIH